MTQSSLAEIYAQDALLNHIKALAFDRSTSSIGETEALYYIKNQLKSNQIYSETQYFSYDNPLNLLIRIAYAIFLIYIVIYRLFVVLVIYLAIKYTFQRTRNYSLVKKEDSKNLLTIIKAKNRLKKRPVIIISAHFDSFSASIPYRLQNVLFFVFRLLVIPYFTVVLTFSLLIISNPVLTELEELSLSNLVIISSIINFIIIVFVFLLIFNTKKSLGSIDNASGVSILIELAKTLNAHPLNYYDVMFVFTGAEEWGLIGSKRFCARNGENLKKKYDLDKSLNINIDMVGTYIGLVDRKYLFRKKKMNRNVNSTIEKQAKQLNIPITKHVRLINPKTDHRNFLKFAKKNKSKFQVACFHSDGDSKYIHSARDTPEKCNSTILNNASNLIFNTINELDENLA